MQPRPFVVLVLAVVAALYYAMGFHLAFLMDSPVFLIPATTLADPAAPPWPYGRGLGYPVLLAGLLQTRLPGLAIVLAHLALIAATYIVIARHFDAASDRLFAAAGNPPPVWLPWMPVGLAVTALYSALHALAGSILSEILFASMAGFAVVAVARVVLEPAVSRRALALQVAVAALPVAVAMTVKPHWLIAGAVLTLTLALAAWLGARRISEGATGIIALAALPIVVTMVTVVADKAVTSARAHPDTALFGARSAFCNNAHLIHRTAVANPQLRLNAGDAADREIRAFLAAVVPPATGGWRVLGFDGDRCLFDDRLPGLGPVLGETPQAQSSALLEAIRRAAFAAPVTFAVRVGKQIGFAVLTPFDRYAVTLGHHEPAFATSGIGPKLGPGFFAGTRRSGAAGLLAWSDEVRNGLLRRIARVVLGVVFVALGLVHAGLVFGLPVIAAVRWRSWPGEVRRAFLGLVGVPLAALLAHHLLVGMVHSFDIWRYAFNTFFVSLTLIGGSALFLARQPAFRRRGGMHEAGL